MLIDPDPKPYRFSVRHVISLGVLLALFLVSKMIPKSSWNTCDSGEAIRDVFRSISYQSPEERREGAALLAKHYEFDKLERQIFFLHSFKSSGTTVIDARSDSYWHELFESLDDPYVHSSKFQTYYEVAVGIAGSSLKQQSLVIFAQDRKRERLQEIAERHGLDVRFESGTCTHFRQAVPRVEY